MITKAFSVFDSKSEVYGAPYFNQHPGVAVRVFTDLVNDPNTVIAKHPEDFTLFEVGSFDDSKGVMLPLGTPINLGVASVFISKIVPKEVNIPGGYPLKSVGSR